MRDQKIAVSGGLRTSAELEEAGWIRGTASDTRTGRPTKFYNLNPALTTK